jgi:hypothetical protein
MRKQFVFLLMVFCVVLYVVPVLAQTPFWWNNPQNYPRFHRVVTSGVVANQTSTPEGKQAQRVTAIVDVPNDYEATLAKSIWVRVSWVVPQGNAELLTAANAHRIQWLNGIGNQCPAMPLDPYPSPDGQGYLTLVGPFTPASPYTQGRELSFTDIRPQPACERLEFAFAVDNNSRLEYQIEVQTICLSIDWADAPDNITEFPDYPTLAASNGPHHIITPALRLGALIDGENDGQPNATATGDDVASLDDEDGLTTPLPIKMIVDTPATFSFDIQMTAPYPSDNVTLAGWVDFDHDGQWEASERVVNQRVGPGPLTLVYPVVPGGYTGPTFARFRLSFDAASVNEPTGFSPNGEVEDYVVTIANPDVDWGDLPEQAQGHPSYPTTLANNGPRHRMLTGLFLGSDADPDPDGQPSVAANGDDNNNTGSADDESGVNGADLSLVEGNAPVIPVNVTIPAGQGTVYIWGWIDYDHDAVVDANETATASATSSGTLQIPLNFQAVPNGSASSTFARFRIGTHADQISAATGLAVDGEVEDYVVTIQRQVIERLDFGDLPENTSPAYPTTLAQNGARHTIVDGLYMGTATQSQDPDAESDGIPSVDALGDDGNTSVAFDDENGVQNPALQLVFLEGQSKNVVVDVHTPINETVYVYGWVDFNRNGTPTANEMASGSWTGLGSGQVTLTFAALPAGLGGHGTYARFRLSTDQASISTPTGQAPDGEVEDYIVQLMVPVELSSFTGTYGNGTVRLEWTTASETDNLGFNVYRSESQNGQYNKVNSQLIQGAGNTQTAHSYSFTDQTITAGQSYFYKLADVRFDGSVTMHSAISVQVPVVMNLLLQNYPNPFNPQTQITFKLMQSSNVELTVYNLQGQVVRNLISQVMANGEHKVVWDGRDAAGKVVTTGTYIYKLKANGYEETKQMELIK